MYIGWQALTLQWLFGIFIDDFTITKSHITNSNNSRYIQVHVIAGFRRCQQVLGQVLTSFNGSRILFGFKLFTSNQFGKFSWLFGQNKLLNTLLVVKIGSVQCTLDTWIQFLACLKNFHCGFAFLFTILIQNIYEFKKIP